jgi:hypothetical protein
LGSKFAIAKRVAIDTLVMQSGNGGFFLRRGD